MKLKIATILAAGVIALSSLGVVAANPSPPTNGGSANGGGSSGQCTGPMDERPAACHNGQGSGN